MAITRYNPDRTNSTILQTSVTFADRLYEDWARLLTKDPAGLVASVALHVSKDQITGFAQVHVFSNDGRGNGELLFTFPLN